MTALRIQRYILREAVGPMIIGLFIFTFVLVMGRSLKLMELVIDKGVPALEIGKLFLDLLPTFFVLTLPLAFLLGVLLAFGRLSAESELVAMKACGIDLYTLFKPVLLLAVVASLITAFLTLYLEPACNSAFRNQLFRIASSQASVGLQEMVFNDDFDGMIVYAAEVDEQQGTLKGIFISDERVKENPATIFAGRGELRSDPRTMSMRLHLEDGAIHRQSKSGSDASYQVIRFGSYDLRLAFGQNLAAAKKRARKENELSLFDLLAARREAANVTEYRTLTAGLHRRFILAAAPLTFALIGVPLGLRSHRSGKGAGFAVALAIFLIYYVLLSFVRTLAVEGGWPPGLVLWLPSLLFFAAGVTMLRFAAQERPFSLAAWWPRFGRS